jgi:hypothetical protein
MPLTVKQVVNGARIEYIYKESLPVVKALFHIITLLLLVIHGYGQEYLNPDRPNASKTPELVKGNNLQLEVGFLKEKINGRQNMYEHPHALLRYGLFNALELRMEIVSQTIKDNVSKVNLKGLTPVYFGVKAKILPENNWMPSIGALAEVGVPSLASGDYFVDGIPFEFRILFNNNINSNFSLQYNFGVAWNETNNQRDNKQWMYTLTPAYKITKNFHVFIEEFAFLRNGTSAEHYFDGGVQYYFTKDLVVDLGAGVGTSKISSDYYIEGGLSYRINFSR